tara:strand:+ start:1188 stop:1454 length:267 start_codon:yes stop_codon:yes gene_type:complete
MKLYKVLTYSLFVFGIIGLAGCMQSEEAVETKPEVAQEAVEASAEESIEVPALVEEETEDNSLIAGESDEAVIDEAVIEEMASEELME